MKIVALYPGQDHNYLSEFINANKIEDILIYSYFELHGVDYKLFVPGPYPSTDDQISIFNSLFLANPKQEFEFLDWPNIFDLKSDYAKLTRVSHNIEVVQEDIRVEDFRLPPFMENLIAVCQQAKLDEDNYLYNNNPKLLVPKIIKGSGESLYLAFSKIIEKRRNIQNRKFTGLLPILNSCFRAL